MYIKKGKTVNKYLLSLMVLLPLTTSIYAQDAVDEEMEEVVTTGISTEQKISPFTMGGNMDDPVDTTIYMSITNLSGSTQSINANLTILQLEA